MNPNHHDDPDAGWADRPLIQRRIRIVLYVICGLLVFADLVVHRHMEVPVEELPAFYAAYGFLALVTVVLAAKGLRHLVGRREDYYDREDDDAA